MEQNISFKNQDGLLLRGIVHIPKKYDTAVIFCHGFPGSHEGSTAGRIGPSLERNGYLVLRFSFSGTFPSEGKFEDKLMSKEVADIRSAVDFLCGNYTFKKLILIGHSTGAIDAALYAHTDQRIDKLILMGMVGDLKACIKYDFNDQQVWDFWTRGYIIYDRPDKAWLHGQKLKKAFYDEFFSLDTVLGIKQYKKPLLFIHGTQDMISLSDPKSLYLVANRPKKFVTIEGGDHQFTRPKHWKQVIEAIVRFAGK